MPPDEMFDEDATVPDVPPVVPDIPIPRPRGRPLGKRKTDPRAMRVQAIAAANDPYRARAIIQSVNHNRMLLANRLVNLDLFPTNEIDAQTWRAKRKANDPLQVQLLWKLREEFDHASAIDDHYQRVQCRTTLLAKMADTINKATEQASQASEEMRKILSDSIASEQRRLEHQQKMDLEKEKLESKLGLSDLDVTEIRTIALGKPGDKP